MQSGLWQTMYQVPFSMEHLPIVDIENHSGFNIRGQKIKPLRKGYYCKIDMHVSGDAPKDFICVYEYEDKVRRNKRSTWPIYIAKVGHKWYPLESVTELLMNRIGTVLGLNMAFSKLAIMGRQVRFLSKYFLQKDEILVHGAEIYAGYLEDMDLTQQIEKENRAREIFTFNFTEKAIRQMFPTHAEDILEQLVQMLIFDAITGNNDRHFYNWAVITHLEDKRPPVFSPIYDTARGLFWNDSEQKLEDWIRAPKQLEDKLLKYAKNSKPKIGWEDEGNLNHFRLAQKIYGLDGRYTDVCRRLINGAKLKKIQMLIDYEFSGLLSHTRITLIKRYLEIRFELLNEFL